MLVSFIIFVSLVVLLGVGLLGGAIALTSRSDRDAKALMPGALIVAVVAALMFVPLLTMFIDRVEQHDKAEQQQRALRVENTCKPFGGVANGRTYEEPQGKGSQTYYSYVCKTGPRVVHVSER